VRFWLVLAGVNGVIAMAAAAIGTHALTGQISEQQLDWFTRAAEHQLWHALALLGLAALMATTESWGLARWAGWAFQIGILLFCGTLYWLGLVGPGSLGPLHVLTPLGGLSLIAGWGLLGVAGSQIPR